MTDAAYDYRLECQALQDLAPGQAIHVTHWRGSEAVSRLYCFEVTFAVRKADLALEQLLNQPATLFAHKPDGTVLRWNGIVTRAAQHGCDETYDYYQVALEPRLARLRTMKWSDIYLNQQLDDIIRQLLRLADLDEPYSSAGAPYDYRIAASQLASTLTPFTCQFEETCLDFLMRKLEFYGVYFWFEQGDGQESIVFANSVDQQPTDLDSVVYYPKGVIDPDAQEVAVTRLNRRVSLRPGLVTLHDSNEWSNTTLSLASTANAPGPIAGFGEVHCDDDHFESLKSDNSVGGDALATWRSQALACERLRIEGEARTPGVCAGRLIEASEYLRGTDPTQYYVVEVTHEGTQTLETAPDTEAAAYIAQFVALPRWLDAGSQDQQPLQFRPACATPVPVVSHLVNGFVDIDTPNQPKQYAQPDQDGRYKVRLTFARQRYGGNQNSAWLRMATPYAGGAATSGLHNAGMHFPLREGTEVLIAFLNGNPDRPVIMAALPNVEAPSMVTAANPGDHIIQTSGGTTLAMRDASQSSSSSGGSSGSGSSGSSSSDDTTPDTETSTAETSIQLSTVSPAASLSLGSISDDNGFDLTTPDNGNIYAGTSMVIQVPGHMRMAAGGAGWKGFTSIQAQNLPPGISAGTSAGIVIQNFMGLKMESVEGITVNHFFGGKISATEALEFSTTIGARLGVKWGGEKDINLRAKKALAPEQQSAYGIVNTIVNQWKGTLVEKEETAVNYSITSLATYKVTSPSIALSAGASFVRLGGPAIDISAPAINVGAVGTTTIEGAIVNISGEATVDLEAEDFMSLTAAALTLTSGATIKCDAPAVTIGGGLVSIG